MSEEKHVMMLMKLSNFQICQQLIFFVTEELHEAPEHRPLTANQCNMFITKEDLAQYVQDVDTDG